MVESVIDEKEEVRDMASGCLCLRLRCGRRRELACVRDTMLLESILSMERLVCLPVVVVIWLEASSSDSRKLVVSRSELSMEDDS